MSYTGIMTRVGTVAILILAVMSVASSYNEIHASRNISNYSYNKTVGHNLILGKVNWGDRLLQFQTIHVPSKFWRKISKDFKFPVGFQSARISYIAIIDLKTDGTGGYPSIISGGIGQRNVTIRLDSQRNHGLHFNVTVMGQ